MSLAETALLGGVAGFTIFLGLPFARMERVGPRARVALAMFSVGDPGLPVPRRHQPRLRAWSRGAVEDARGAGSDATAVGYTVMFIAGLFIGIVGLTLVERRSRRAPAALPPLAGGAVDTLPAEHAAALVDFEAAAAEGPRAAHRHDGRGRDRRPQLRRGPGDRRLGPRGEIGLATILIVGFAAHNATEGFGIVGPLGSVRPSWRWLGLAGFIGGAPTLVGAIVGYHVTSPALELAFYALAGGALLYVVGEIWNGVRRLGHRELGMYMLFAGLSAGFLTDLILVAGGA